MKRAISAEVPFIISMIAFGTIGLFVRLIGLQSAEIALWRAVLGALFIGGVFLFQRRMPGYGSSRRNFLLLCLSGGAMGVNWILLFEAYKYTSVSLATLSYYFAPVLVTLLSPFLFKERLGTKGLVSFFGATAGLVLITLQPSEGGSIVGILFGISAAVFYATVIILNKKLTDVGGLERTFWQFVFAAIVLAIYTPISSGIELFSLDQIGAVMLLTVGIFHTGITYLLYFGSLAQLEGQRVALLSYVDPLVAALLSVSLLGERMTLLQAIGGVMILGFTLISELSFKKKKSG